MVEHKCIVIIPAFNEEQSIVRQCDEIREKGQYKLQIHGGGMGCALIRMDVFKRIPYPWYDWVNYHDANHGMLSEDLYFCEGCRKANIPVYTDTRAGCGHMLRHIQFME